MRILLLALALLIGAAAHACAPGDISVVTQPRGEITEKAPGLWEREYYYGILCQDDTVSVRTILVRYEGEYALADSALDFYADQYADDVLHYYQYEAFDWRSDIREATDMIANDDIIPAFERLVVRIRELGNPNVGQMAAEWRAIAMTLSWVRTTEQADSLLYRAADAFGMSGVGMLNYIKANVQYVP